MDDTRESQLLSLLRMEGSTSALVAELAVYPWDRAHDLVNLESDHIVHALARFVDGKVSADEVEAWAIAIRDREDIDQDPDSGLGRVLYELSHPHTTQPLTVPRAKALMAQLRWDAS